MATVILPDMFAPDTEEEEKRLIVQVHLHVNAQKYLHLHHICFCHFHNMCCQVWFYFFPMCFLTPRITVYVKFQAFCCPPRKSLLKRLLWDGKSSISFWKGAAVWNISDWSTILQMKTATHNNKMLC